MTILQSQYVHIGLMACNAQGGRCSQGVSARWYCTIATQSLIELHKQLSHSGIRLGYMQSQCVHGTLVACNAQGGRCGQGMSDHVAIPVCTWGHGGMQCPRGGCSQGMSDHIAIPVCTYRPDGIQYPRGQVQSGHE